MATFLSRLTQHTDKLQSQHQALVNRPWLALPSGNIYVGLILLLSIVAAFANFHVRSQQYSHWESRPEVFFFQDTPLFSTMDAGYFLGIAQSLSRQDTPNDFEARRSFPDGKNSAKNVSEVGPGKAPLLSSLIYLLSDNDSPQALLEAGNAIIPVTAAITALAIILCFGATGYWLEGSVAAIGGGLSMAYLQRSAIGRIDTDQLNLGFFYLLFGLAIWAGRAKNWQTSLGVTILAGLTARLFMEWYGKSELIWISLFALFWMLLVCSRDWRRTIGLSILFILLSGVQIVDISSSIYVRDSVANNALQFPNVLTTVSEVNKIELRNILLRMTGSVELCIVGLAGMVFWAVRHPVFAVALGPLAVFALLNTVVGNRVIFYSAPTVWFGLAFILITATRAVYQMAIAHFGGRQDFSQTENVTVSGVIASCLLVFSYLVSPTKYIPQAAIPVQVVSALQSLQGVNDEKEAVMASWWDYGYSSLLFNKLPVFTDGGTQISPPTYMMAKALLAPSLQETANILRFMAREGSSGIASHASSQKTLFNHIASTASKPAPAIYLLLTDQMTRWIGSISKIGNWNLDTGKAIPISGNPGGSSLGYNTLTCQQIAAPSQLKCDGQTFNLRSGELNGQLFLDGAVRTRQGLQIGGVAFPGRQFNVFQMAEINQTQKFYLLHRDLFKSSFNQLFHLGRAKNTLFEMVYDDYPHARIFRLRTQK